MISDFVVVVVDVVLLFFDELVLTVVTVLRPMENTKFLASTAELATLPMIFSGAWLATLAIFLILCGTIIMYNIL